MPSRWALNLRLWLFCSFVAFQQAQNCCTGVQPAAPCISYDPRAMANSIDEALFNFPNLASNRQTTLFTPQPQPSLYTQDSVNTFTANRISGSGYVVPATQNTAASASCDTPDCMSCKLEIINGFLQNPAISPADNASLWDQKWNLQSHLGTNQGSCNMANNGNSKKTQPNARSGKETHRNNTRRFKRMPNDPYALLGVVTQLGCDYRRGAALNDDSPWSGLCNLCWQWRKLPDDYFPNYLNEVNCDPNDDGCLSGFGECRPVLRTINVLRNVGGPKMPRWVEETVDTATACECQVAIGTPLHDFVLQ